MSLQEQLFNFLGDIVKEDDDVVKDLVVNKNGVPAGTIVTSADYNSGSTCNELLFFKSYADQLSDFWIIDNAEAEFLDTLGYKWLGVRRAPGEDDATYLKRIRATLAEYRNTPYGLEQLMLFFSPNYVLIQEGLIGYGAVGRTFIEYYDQPDQNYDDQQPVEESETVSAINVGLDTFTVTDGSVFAAGDEVYHDDGVSDPRMYLVDSVSVNDVTIVTKGYKIKNGVWDVGATFSATNPMQITTAENHGMATGDQVYFKDASPAELPEGDYVITVTGANTFTIAIDNSLGSGGTADIWWAYVDGVVSIDGAASGSLIKYEEAIITRSYVGSVSSGVLRIRVTIESTSLTNDPVVAKFIRDLLENSKIPGAQVELVKVVIP